MSSDKAFPLWQTLWAAVTTLAFVTGGCGSDRLVSAPTSAPEAKPPGTNTPVKPAESPPTTPDTPLPVCPLRGVPKIACETGTPSRLRLSPGQSVWVDALGPKSHANDLVIDDYNGDGIRDVVVFFSSDREGHSGLALLIGDNTGNFELQSQTSLGTWLPLRAETADLGGGRHVDFAVIGIGDPCAAEPDPALMVKVLLDSPDREGWVVADSYPLGPHEQLVGVGGTLSPIALGDADNDGDIDILAGTSLRLLTNAGNGTFTLSSPDLGGVSHDFFDIAAADLNNDGRLDLATVDGSRWVMQVFYGNGAGHFVPQNEVGWQMLADSPERIITGDFNGDGSDDVRTVHESCYDVYYRNPGDSGSWPEGEVYHTTQDPTFREAVGDFDGDGYDDLALVGMGDQMTILVLGPDGSVSQEHTLTNLSNLAGSADYFVLPQIASGDLNNDCLPDLVVGARDERTFHGLCTTEAGERPLLEVLLAEPCGS